MLHHPDLPGVTVADLPARRAAGWLPVDQSEKPKKTPASASAVTVSTDQAPTPGDPEKE